MIKYALACDKGHTFESWFADSGAYDKQARRGLVTCPVCNSAKVEKAIMAPRLSGARKRGTSQEVVPVQAQSPAQAPAAMPVMSPMEQELRAKLKELRDHIVKNSDNVGEKFPEEARKMHYGETEHRSIHGIASIDDAKALAEEGIEVQPIPILPDDRN